MEVLGCLRACIGSAESSDVIGMWGDGELGCGSDVRCGSDVVEMWDGELGCDRDVG